jgi:hypothetical protein
MLSSNPKKIPHHEEHEVKDSSCLAALLLSLHIAASGVHPQVSHLGSFFVLFVFLVVRKNFGLGLAPQTHPPLGGALR